MVAHAPPRIIGHRGAKGSAPENTLASICAAKAQGCAHIIMADDDDIVGKVRKLTDGKGVAAVFDSVGKDTFYTSLDCLRKHGTMVSFGNASGPVEPFSPGILAPKGSLYVTRPTLATHTATRELLDEGANRLFEVVRNGIVRINVNQTYPLEDAAQAHRDLESRATTGSTVLMP